MKFTKLQIKHYLSSINSLLQVIASLTTIFGLTILTLWGNLSNTLPGPLRRSAEKDIEQIKVYESSAYVESILGLPKRFTPFEYSDSHNISQTGRKGVYINDHYILLVYYDTSDVCIGYIVVSRDTKFSPKLFRNEEIFDNEFQASNIIDAGGLSLVGNYSCGTRADCSSYHIQYYYHHLGTNNCYLGIGYSDLGVSNKMAELAVQNYNSSNTCNSNNTLTEVTLTNKEALVSQCDIFNSIKPNVFSVFLNDGTFDTNSLLQKELQFSLGITLLEFRQLVD